MKMSKTVSPVILAGVVVAAAAGVGAYYGINKTDDTTQVAVMATPTTTTTATAVPSDVKTYTSAEIGLSFEYPASLGDVKLEVSDVKKEGAGTGKIFNGKFSAEPTVTFGGVTDDFSGGRGSKFTDSLGYAAVDGGFALRPLAIKGEDKLQPLTEKDLVSTKEVPTKDGSALLFTGLGAPAGYDDINILPYEKNQAGLVVNLRGSEFKGVSFFVHDTSKLSVADLTKIAASIKVVNPDVATTWKTFTDSGYGLTFKYPTSFGTASALNVTSEDQPLPVAKASAVTFKENGPYVLVSSVDQWSDADHKDRLDALKKTYAEKKATALPSEYPFGINAALIGATSPQYIQSGDGKYRGAYWFAEYGQDFNRQYETQLAMHTLVVVLTDNDKNVVQIMDSAPGTNYSQTQCVSVKEDAKDLPCNIDQQSTDTVLATYQDVLSTLKAL